MRMFAELMFLCDVFHKFTRFKIRIGLSIAHYLPQRNSQHFGFSRKHVEKIHFSLKAITQIYLCSINNQLYISAHDRNA